MATSIYQKTFQHLVKQNALDAGIILFSEIIEQIPNDAEGYLYRSLCYASQSNVPSAVVDIVKALDIAPSDGYVHYVHGNIRQQMNDAKGAVRAYTEAINHGFVKAYNNRGVMFLQAKRYRAARNDFNSHLQQYPNSASAYQNRGIVRYHFGDYMGAYDDLHTALSIKPRNTKSQAILGCIQFALGQYDDVRQTVRRVQEQIDTLTAPLQAVINHLSETQPLNSQSIKTNTYRGALADTKPLQEISDQQMESYAKKSRKTL